MKTIFSSSSSHPLWPSLPPQSLSRGYSPRHAGGGSPPSAACSSHSWPNRPPPSAVSPPAHYRRSRRRGRLEDLKSHSSFHIVGCNPPFRRGGLKASGESKLAGHMPSPFFVGFCIWGKRGVFCPFFCEKTGIAACDLQTKKRNLLIIKEVPLVIQMHFFEKTGKKTGIKQGKPICPLSILGICYRLLIVLFL